MSSGLCVCRRRIRSDPAQEGSVYAVEFSHRSGRDLINMAKKRTNVIRASLLVRSC